MATKTGAIRPFSIKFPEEALDDLRRRINATKDLKTAELRTGQLGGRAFCGQALRRARRADERIGLSGVITPRRKEIPCLS